MQVHVGAVHERVAGAEDRDVPARVEMGGDLRGGVVVEGGHGALVAAGMVGVFGRNRVRERKLEVLAEIKAYEEGWKDVQELGAVVKAGDKILFGKFSGSEVKLDDKEYLIMREEDVLAILE